MNQNQQGVQLIESEEEKKKKAGQSQPGSAFAGGTTSPTGTNVAPSGTQQARAAQAAGPTKGTGFTGVGRYLQANVGSRLGEQVAGRVAQTGQQAATRLGQAVGQFGQQLGSKDQGTGLYGQLTTQQQAAQRALQRIAGKPAETPTTAPEGEVPPAVDLTPSQEEVAAYQAVAGGQFQAPTGLQDIGDIRSQAQLAGQLAAGTRDTAGRLGLLRQVVGRGPQQYTKGQSALDALILGQSGGQLAAARRASAGLERRVGTKETLAAERARQFGAETERAKEEITGEATGLEKKTTSDILARQADYNTKLQQLSDKIKEEIESGRLSPEVADALSQYGITPSTRIYDRDFKELATFLAATKAPAEELTATTKEEAARLQALKKLAGIGRDYSQEELEKIETTIDPATGLDISPEEFYEKFVKAGEARVQSAQDLVKKLLPDLKTIDFVKGTASPKDVSKVNSVFSSFKKQKSDIENKIKWLKASIQRTEEENRGSTLGNIWRTITGQPRPRPVDTGPRRDILMDLERQLSSVNKNVNAINTLLKEYGKGQSFLRTDELSK